MKTIICPECGSENVQRAEIAYDAGTMKTRGSSVSFGAAFSNAGSALLSGITSSEQTQRTMLAKRVAPPQKRQQDYRAESTIASARIVPAIALVIALLGLAAWTSSVAVAVLLFISAPLVWHFHSKRVQAAKARLAEIEHYNSTIWPEEYQKWRESWLCHKCGYLGAISLSTA